MVVTDAGPILHLYWVDALDWVLPSGPVHVVDPVWREVQHHAPHALQSPALQRVSSLIEVPDELRRSPLHEGERAALALAMTADEAGDVLFLCDEREARRAAASYGFQVVGSIGLIVEAFRSERAARDQAVDALLNLPSRGRLHVRTSLIHTVISQL